MENTATDYKKLYLDSLTTLALEREKVLLLLAQKQQAHQEELAAKDQQIADLNFELDKFRRYLFGKKSEKLSFPESDPSQLSLFNLETTVAQQEDLSQQASVAPPKKKPKKRANTQGRMTLPEDLRREIILIEPDEDVSQCVKIGEEITEVLDLIPAQLYVKRYVRPKYARPGGKGIAIGQLPDRIVEKGIPSDQLIAKMVLDKYVYGLPLHRQIDQYRRLGVTIAASTASDWVIRGWKHLSPLWELLKLVMAHQKYLQADESPINVLDRDHKDGIHKGYMWVYHAPCAKLVLFDYRKGRDHLALVEILRHFRGVLQADGYSAYETLLSKNKNIILIHCMAHARRKFFEALNYDHEKATHMLALIGALYKIEQEMRDKNLTWQERTIIRQEKAVPILNNIKAWMLENAPKTLPSSPLGKAIAYTLNRWEGLSAYAQHGQLEIDNNLVENAIRPLAIGRKNFMFAGSHHSAEMTAAMYSFMATCKKNNLNEWEWLTDVMARIQSHKHKDLYQLLPNNWLKYKNIPQI